VPSTESAIVHGALALVRTASWAGICLIQGKRVTPEASSHDLWRAAKSMNPYCRAISR
jgi:hypothetical protein